MEFVSMNEEPLFAAQGARPVCCPYTGIEIHCPACASIYVIKKVMVKYVKQRVKGGGDVNST